MTGIKRMRVPPVLRGIRKLWTGAEEQEAVEQGKRDHCTSRPDWVFMLTREQIQDYTMEQVLGGTDGWNPGAYI